MAGFLPNELIAITAMPNDNDVLIIQVDGNSIVDKISYSDFMKKGVASGVCPLDATNLIPSIHLPSYVDDVLEENDLASFPVTGEAGKIYVALDSNKTYRWSGSAYIEIGSGLYASDIGTSVQAYDADTVIDSGYADTKATINAGGDTASRPASPVLYSSYVDTTLGKPIWYDGTNWIDATGTVV